MSVTMEFFDGITFDIAKQNYYNANKVDARMEVIKAAFAELIEENNELRRLAGKRCGLSCAFKARRYDTRHGSQPRRTPDARLEGVYLRQVF